MILHILLLPRIVKKKINNSPFMLAFSRATPAGISIKKDNSATQYCRDRTFLRWFKEKRMRIRSEKMKITIQKDNFTFAEAAEEPRLISLSIVSIWNYGRDKCIDSSSPFFFLSRSLFISAALLLVSLSLFWWNFFFALIYFNK